MKVFYNKVFLVEDILKSEQIETYVPCKLDNENVSGSKSSARKTPISGLLFFRCSEKICRKISIDYWGRLLVYSRKVDDLWSPAPIPDDQFNVFRLVTSSGDEGLEYFDEKIHFKKGQAVRVIGGILKNAVGRIVRIKGDRRLVVEITGVCAVATSYIPQCYLEKIEE